MIRHLLPPFAILALCLPLCAAEPGSVRGRVPLGRVVVPVAVEKYLGRISGKVAPPPRPVAGVWLEAPGLRAPSAAGSVKLEQRGYQFASWLLIVPVGSRVEFPNLDPEFHNVRSLRGVKRFDIGRYKPDERPSPVETFDKPGVVLLSCEIHEHMRGAIVVVDSPFFSRTAEDGSFAIPRVPPGTYTLRAWLDEKREWAQPVTVVSGRAAEVNLPEK